MGSGEGEAVPLNALHKCVLGQVVGDGVDGGLDCVFEGNERRVEAQGTLHEVIDCDVQGCRAGSNPHL